MNATAHKMESTATLRDLRRQKNLSHEDVVAWIAQYRDAPPLTPRASVLWEWRGVQKAAILTALAALYGVSMEEIQRAADNSRVTRGPRMKAGRPGKNITKGSILA